MSALQAWLVAGVPALTLGLALFIGRRTWRTRLGYAVLAGGFAAMAAVDPVSGAVFGGLLALLYASGRGGELERPQQSAG